MASIKELLQSMIKRINSKNEGVDWIENDETSPAFVKNRTHYITNEVIPEQTVTAIDDDGYFWADINDMHSDFEVGKKYIVYYNSTQYECIATEEGIGNYSLDSEDQEYDTGEPFFIWNDAWATFDSAGEKTIKVIAYDTSVYVPIDLRFIPNNIPGHKLIHNTVFTVDVGRIDLIPVSDHYKEIDKALRSGDYEYIHIRAKKELDSKIYTYSIRVDSSSTISYALVQDASGLYKRKFYIKGIKENAYWFGGDDHAIICNNMYGPLDKDKTLYLKSSTADSTKQYRMTVEDGGVPTISNADDDTDKWTPYAPPTVTADDAGKFLRVSAEGKWVAEELPSAEGVSY